MTREDDLRRIADGLAQAREALAVFVPGKIEARMKSKGNPVTAADLAVDAVLREALPRPGEGWLSEESTDGPERLECERVWVVDPVDGTKEFVAGIPEWSVSIGLVEAGQAVAGGICNPAADLTVLGAAGHGVWVNDQRVLPGAPRQLDGATVLASRSEMRRGEWERFKDEPFTVVAMGSVAYKLARVAAGLAGATWTLVPKNEWDVAAGTALIEAAGGRVWNLDGERPRFNRKSPRLDGLVGVASAWVEAIGARLDSILRPV